MSSISKSNLILISFGFLIFAGGIIFYLLRTNTINHLNLFQKQTDIPQITSAVETDADTMWVWLVNTKIQVKDGEYYLTGNFSNDSRKKISVLLGSESDIIGYTFSDKTTKELDADFPNFFPDWKVGDVKTIATESVNNKNAILKIYTKIPIIDDCDQACQDYKASLSEYLDSNKLLINQDTNAIPNNVTIGPAAQILFF